MQPTRRKKISLIEEAKRDDDAERAILSVNCHLTYFYKEKFPQAVPAALELSITR